MTRTHWVLISTLLLQKAKDFKTYYSVCSRVLWGTDERLLFHTLHLTVLRSWTNLAPEQTSWLLKCEYKQICLQDNATSLWQITWKETSACIQHECTQSHRVKETTGLIIQIITVIMYMLMLSYAVLGHGLLHTLRKTGAIYNWYPAFTASPGVLQEITTDPITVCIQHTLVNLCKSHNCSWFYNSWTRGMRHWHSTRIHFSATREYNFMSAQNSNQIQMCKGTWAKWFQKLILQVRKIINLICDEMPLGDTVLTWCFLTYRWCLFSSEKSGSW